jgi:hypothetical protein
LPLKSTEHSSITVRLDATLPGAASKALSRAQEDINKIQIPAAADSKPVKVVAAVINADPLNSPFLSALYGVVSNLGVFVEVVGTLSKVSKYYRLNILKMCRLK